MSEGLVGITATRNADLRPSSANHHFGAIFPFDQAGDHPASPPYQLRQPVRL